MCLKKEAELDFKRKDRTVQGYMRNIYISRMDGLLYFTVY